MKDDDENKESVSFALDYYNLYQFNCQNYNFIRTLSLFNIKDTFRNKKYPEIYEKVYISGVPKEHILLWLAYINSVKNYLIHRGGSGREGQSKDYICLCE